MESGSINKLIVATVLYRTGENKVGKVVVDLNPFQIIESILFCGWNQLGSAIVPVTQIATNATPIATQPINSINIANLKM